MSRYWCSWVCTEEDHRPVTYPPGAGVLGWWCSGYDAADNSTLCALIEAEDADAVAGVVRADWPEFGGAWRIEPKVVPDDFLPGDRFPLSDWMRERVGADAPPAAKPRDEQRDDG